MVGLGFTLPLGADEGGGTRDLPPVKGHTGLSHHIGAALMADEFDMSFFQGKPLDHAEVVAQGQAAGERIGRLLRKVIEVA